MWLATEPPACHQTSFTSSMVMQLRSALAAVNAMDLRRYDTDEAITGTGNITSREIPIYDFTSGNPVIEYTARVYGTKKQPFITEVYVNTYQGDPGDALSTDLNKGKKNRFSRRD